MKRRIMALGMAACMVMGTMSTAATVSAEETSYEICWTVADLSNPVWAEKIEQAEKTAEELGCTFEAVACNNDASTQVAQIENFIERDVDAIIIGAADVNALVDVCKKAMDAGIVVSVEGTKMENYTVSYTADNYAAGRMIGEQAAKFINENYDGVAEVGLISYYELYETMVRGQGMVDALTELCPGATVVQECSTCLADEAMTYVENWLQANPDMKVIMSIGDGGGIGANQAVKAAGKADGFGIFAVDGTVEALQLMADGDPIKAELAFGSGWQIGKGAVETTYKALTEEDFEKDYYQDLQLVTMDNLEEMISVWGYEDRVDLSNLK